MKLDKAFPPTPAAFGDAVFKGIREGEKRMKMKYKMRLSMIAACLVVCLLVGAYAAGTGDQTDTTSVSAPEGGGAIIGGSNEKTDIFVTVSLSPTPENVPYPGDKTAQEEMVYITERGIFYHSDPTCSGMKNGYLVPVSEAEEEGKHSCPVCLSDRYVDPNTYFEKAMDSLEAVFPGSVQVYMEHYNTEQFHTDLPWVDDDIVDVNLFAGDVKVALVQFDSNRCINITFFFKDVEICRKILACREENTLSDKLVDLSLICKEELLNNLLTTVHDSVRSRMPVSSEYYNLQIIELSFADEECMTAAFHFVTQYSCEASFTFDL
ncbi:MAG: hypothetical protein II920_02425, partial [Clostridia bacterium]|nr:hypothetical protein [Clostridia bacterium]